MRKLMAISLLVWMLALGTVLADERCADGQNVSYGLTESEVLSKCGPPVEIYNHYNGLNILIGREYIYEPGPGSFLRHFYFGTSGRVTQMWVGDKRQ